MTSIFISHSSKDDALASQLEAWLKSNGFVDLFIDHSNIHVGMNWANALRAAAGACRVVVCLTTENWLASEQCVGEFNAAWYMGKRLLPLFLLRQELPPTSQTTLQRVMAEDQGLDLTPFYSEARGLDFFRDEAGAEKLRAGLRAAGALTTVGLDPEAFEVDRMLMPVPFPGLASYGDNDADAALFFGRSREIAEILEEVRAMRATSDRRSLIILGASGAGKSSLLKAGIIPRLRREAPAWIALRAFRPGADPLLNFAEAVARTLADFGVFEAHGTIRRTLLKSWKRAQGEVPGANRSDIATTLDSLGAKLRAAAARPGATILVSVDQGEELTRSEDESGAALADFLRAMLKSGADWRLALTIRTDSFPELQAHPRFQGLEGRCYDLRVLPTYRFADVVCHPAKRYGALIDPALVDQLMEDAPSKDALPLLAFALQRLWSQFAPEGRLGVSEYRAMRGLSGLIGDAAERALCGIEPEQWTAALPTDGAHRAQEERAERTFVPALVEFSDEGAAIRHLAAWDEFDDEQKALLDRFSRWRLVVKRGHPPSIEVAHEALFREWPRLATWLETERGRLEVLRGLVTATDAWRRHQKNSNFAIHSGRRLREVRELQKSPRYRGRIDPSVNKYIAACRRKALRNTLGLLGVATAIPMGFALLITAFLGFSTLSTELQQEQAKPRYAGYAHTNGSLTGAPPGTQFQDCRDGSADCPIMVTLPSGKFLMGSAESDHVANDDEFPQHLVSIGKFAVSKYEITQGEWQACQNAGGCTFSGVDDGMVGDRRPEMGMNWEDAEAYAKWLTRMTGQKYRLLSEAEWEYAARAVTTSAGPNTVYSWGNAPPVCDPNASNGAAFANCDPQETRDVGTFRPNAFGLYDMHGNAAEWVQDCQNKGYSTMASDGPVLLRYDSCAYHVVRGGSWLDNSQNLRSAFRDEYVPSLRVTDFGFRLARSILD